MLNKIESKINQVPNSMQTNLHSGSNKEGASLLAQHDIIINCHPERSEGPSFWKFLK